MDPIANEVIEKINNIYKEKGFVSEDTVFDMIMDNGLALDETDRICDTLLSMGVLIQNEPLIEEIEDISDRAQLDYDEIFNQVVEKEPSLKEFIDKVRLIPPPKTREVINLMPQAKSGNEYARTRLIEMMMKVAVKMALSFSDKYDTALDETIQYALEGLVVAYEKFEIGKQDNFATYAPWWIRQNISRTIDLGNGMHIPVHIDEQLMNAVNMASEHYCEKCSSNEICPNLIIEYSEKYDCDTEKAKSYYQIIMPLLSIEESHQSGKDLLIWSNDDDLLDKTCINLRRETICRILKTIKPKEEKIIRLRFGFDDGEEKTLEEVGQLFNVTRERIRQIEVKVLRKLRHPSRSKLLADFNDDFNDEGFGEIRFVDNSFESTDYYDIEETMMLYEPYDENISDDDYLSDIEDEEDVYNESHCTEEAITSEVIQKDNKPPAYSTELNIRDKREFTDVAIKQLETSANDYNVEDMIALGDLYYSNNRFDEAMFWYEMAAEFENDVALFKLALMYKDGIGTKVNEEKALELLRKASDLNNSNAMNEIGVFYYNLDDINDYYSEAFKWFKQAVTSGNAIAQSNLALCYEYGLGCSVDIVTAKTNYELAIKQGFEKANTGLQRVKKKLENMRGV